MTHSLLELDLFDEGFTPSPLESETLFDLCPLGWDEDLDEPQTMPFYRLVADEPTLICACPPPPRTR